MGKDGETEDFSGTSLQGGAPRRDVPYKGALVTAGKKDSSFVKGSTQIEATEGDH